MSDKNLVNIIIPIYKEEITFKEKMSLRQCIRILSAHPITLICPKRLNLDTYYNEYTNFKVEYFNKLYFKELHGYNRLMLSKKLYKRFKCYKYLLIYQLDAWVFRDELYDWCSKDYSYIGAPWFEGMDTANPESPFMGVGNGGFSLRQTNQILKLLRRKEYYQNLEKVLRIMKILPFFKKHSLINKTISSMEKFNYCIGNEDYKISVMASYVKKFKLAPIEEAYRFSFEVNPEVLYKLNNRSLPFGCHAWEKHNPAFWNTFITLNA